MGSKTFRSTAFKRAIDTGKVSTLSVDDLVKVWRVEQGDEKSISLADLAVGVTTNVEDLNTGFVYGLNLSINGADNTKFDIAAGEYVITDLADLDNIIVKIIKVTSPILGITPFYLATRSASYIALDDTQTIIQSDSPFTDADRRSLAILGAVIHSNNININTTNEIKAPIVASTNQLHDLMRALGSFNLEGNVYGAGTTGLRITKSAGEVFGLGINAHDTNDPHQLTIPLQTDLTFRYRLRDSTEYADTLAVDPNNYDLGGVLTTVPNNRFTVQRFNLFQSGLTRTQYGQVIYLNFEEAKLLAPAEPFEVEKNIADNAIFRAYLIIKKGVTDLASAIIAEEAAFIPVDKFGNVVTGGGSVLTSLAIITALGYTPESDANKVTDFSVVNNTVYPTTQAVSEFIGAKISGTTNYVSYFTPDGNTLGSTNIYTNGTRYAIGQASFDAETNFFVNQSVTSTPANNQYAIRGNIDLNFSGDSLGYASVLGYTKVRALSMGASFNLIRGVYSAIDNVWDATIDEAHSAYNIVVNRSTGTINTANSVYSQIRNISTGLINTASNLRSYAPSNFGTIALYYGVKVDDYSSVTGITQGWSVFSSGANTKSQFEGKVLIGVGTQQTFGTAQIFGDLNINKLTADSYIRFTESDNYQGSFINYDGINNILKIGVHNTADSLIASDFTVLSFPRLGSFFEVFTVPRLSMTSPVWQFNETDRTNENWAFITSSGVFSLRTATSTFSSYTTRLQVLQSGFFGFGNITPSVMLDVEGSARVRTISNGTGDFLTKSATGVITSRTVANVITDLSLDTNYVTIATAQTITGAKIFSNALLVQEANTPILRLKTANNTQAVLNFRNSINEDQAGLQFDAGVGKLSLLTRTANTDIEIFPNGTGSILLPNVPSGTGDVLMLNGSGEVVKGIGSALTQTTGTFTPTMYAVSGGITYTFTTLNANYIKIGRIVFFSIGLSSISSTGSPTGLLIIGGLPFIASGTSGRFWTCPISQFYNSSLALADSKVLRGAISQGNDHISISYISQTVTAPTFTGTGNIHLSGFYETDS